MLTFSLHSLVLSLMESLNVSLRLGAFSTVQCISLILFAKELLFSWPQEAFPSGLAAALPTITVCAQPDSPWRAAFLGFPLHF